MTPAMSVRLVLDEMFSPRIAAALRERDHDVVAVAGRNYLRSMTDEDLFGWAADGRWRDRRAAPPLTEDRLLDPGT